MASLGKFFVLLWQLKGSAIPFLFATKEALHLGLVLFKWWIKYRETQAIRSITEAVNEARKGDQRKLEAIISNSSGAASPTSDGLLIRDAKKRS